MFLRIIKRLFWIVLPKYYRLKIALYGYLVGNEALSHVLYKCLFPEVVLRIGGATIGIGTRINRGLTIHESSGSFKNLFVGDHVHIGKFVFIDLSGRVTIGNRVTIAMFARILTHQNLGDSQLSSQYPPIKGSIEIPDDVVISCASIVLFPTKLAKTTLISAGSVVRGEYREPCILRGNPARVSVRLHENGKG